MSFWYLGSPYSRYPAGMEAAYKRVCHEASRLVRAGVPVFSPIAHSHGIAVHGVIDPTAHGIWLPADRPFMNAAKGLIVLKLPGWSSSTGLFHEVGEFAKMGKPVVYMESGIVPKEVLPI